MTPHDNLDARKLKIEAVRKKLIGLKRRIVGTLNLNPPLKMDDEMAEGDYRTEGSVLVIKYSETEFVNRPFINIRNEIYKKIGEIVDYQIETLQGPDADKFTDSQLEQMVDDINRIRCFTKIIDEETQEVVDLQHLPKLRRIVLNILDKSFNSQKFEEKHGANEGQIDQEVFDAFLSVDFGALKNSETINAKCNELVSLLKLRGIKSKGLENCVKDLLIYIGTMYTMLALFSIRISDDGINNMLQTPITFMNYFHGEALRAFIVALPKDDDEA